MVITDLITARQLDKEFESTIDIIISTKEDVDTGLSVILLCKPNLNKDVKTIGVTLNHYAWIEYVKQAVKLSRGKRTKRIWLLTSDRKLSSIIGLVNCLNKGESGKFMRFFWRQKITDANRNDISDINNNQGGMENSLNRNKW